MRISDLGREGMFGVVEEQYEYNPRNQLTTRRIGTPIIMDDPQGGGATKEIYVYDPNGNTTEINEYTKPIIAGTNNYGPEKHLNATQMQYDELNRQTAYQSPEGEEHTQYRGAEWHRWQTQTESGLTRYFHDALTDNMISDQESTLRRNFSHSGWRCLLMHVPNTWPSATWRAANRVVVPLRL